MTGFIPSLEDLAKRVCPRPHAGDSVATRTAARGREAAKARHACEGSSFRLLKFIHSRVTQMRRFAFDHEFFLSSARRKERKWRIYFGKMHAEPHALMSMTASQSR
jgi:hypothetical protein